MKKILFLLLVFNIVLFSQRDSTGIILTFSEPMDTSTLKVLSNYSMYDSTAGKVHQIYSVRLPKQPPFDRVVLIIAKPTYHIYKITAKNVKDVAGNIVNPLYNSAEWTITFSAKIPVPFISFYKDDARDTLKIINAYAKDTSQVTTLPYRAYDKITYRGNINEIWTSNPIPEWIIIELDQARTVRQLNLSFSYFHDARVYSYSIDYSYFPDRAWYNAVPLAYSEANKEWVTQDVNFSCKYIRINFITNNQSNWAGLYEIQVLGE